MSKSDGSLRVEGLQSLWKLVACRTPLRLRVDVRALDGVPRVSLRIRLLWLEKGSARGLHSLCSEVTTGARR